MIDPYGNPVCELYVPDCTCITGKDVGAEAWAWHYIETVNPDCTEHGRHTWPTEEEWKRQEAGQ